MGGLASGGCDRPVRKRQRLHACPAGTEGPRRPSPRPTVRTGPHRPDTRPAARRPGTSGPRHNARRPTFQHPACSNYTPARALGPPPDSRPPGDAAHPLPRPAPDTPPQPVPGKLAAPHHREAIRAGRTGTHPSTCPAPARTYPPSRDVPRPDFRKIFAECASI